MKVLKTANWFRERTKDGGIQIVTAAGHLVCRFFDVARPGPISSFLGVRPQAIPFYDAEGTARAVEWLPEIHCALSRLVKQLEPEIEHFDSLARAGVEIERLNERVLLKARFLAAKELLDEVGASE